MQALRKLVFYVFTAIYIVFCPLIILYAFGYIYRPDEPNGVTQTGLIYLATAPTNAAVYINGSLYPQKTPALLPGLLPGDYSIRLFLEGYEAWEKKLPVEIEKATVLDRILLVPEKLEREKLLEGTIRELIPVPENDFFLIKNDKTLGSIRVYDCDAGEARSLFESDSPFYKFSLLEYFMIEKSPASLFYVGSPEGENFLWIQLDKEKSKPKDITSLFQIPPRQIKWLPRQQTNLFSFQGGYLNRVDLDSGAVYPKFIPNVRGYDLFNGQVYVLKENNVLMKTGYDAKSETVLLKDPALALSIFGKKGSFQVEVLSERIILFLGENGELLANRLPYRFVKKGVKGIKIDQGSQHVLIWQKDRIGILDFSVEETDNIEFEKGPRLTWIHSGGKNIGQCFWTYQTSHVLFRDLDKVYLITAKPYGQYKTDYIAAVKKGTSIYYLEETGKLYFLEPSFGELTSVRIIPEKGLIPMPFSATKEQKEADIETERSECEEKQ
jgi:hypothetical protein